MIWKAIPRDQAYDNKKGTSGPLAACETAVGDQTTVSGVHVVEKWHGWREAHPKPRSKIRARIARVGLMTRFVRGPSQPPQGPLGASVKRPGVGVAETGVSRRNAEPVVSD